MPESSRVLYSQSHLQGYKLEDAVKLLLLTGMTKKPVTLTWGGHNCSTMEFSGLDGVRKDDMNISTLLMVNGHTIKMSFSPLQSPNKDGHVNNYVQIVEDDPNSANAIIRKKLTGDDPDLTTDERLKIRQFLEAYLIQ